MRALRRQWLLLETDSSHTWPPVEGASRRAASRRDPASGLRFEVWNASVSSTERRDTRPVATTHLRNRIDPSVRSGKLSSVRSTMDSVVVIPDVNTGVVIDEDDAAAQSPSVADSPRLPVYLDGDLLEALAQTLDPSGVPGTRRVQTTQMGRTLEGQGYAVRAGGRIGTRLLGAQASGERKGSGEAEESDAQTEEQEFVIREATLLWQAHSLLAEEGHLKIVDASTIQALKAGDWVEMRVRATGRSLLSFARLAARFLSLQSAQAQQRLDRLREGELLLRGAKSAPTGMKIGELSVNDARQVFLTDLVASLAAGTDAASLQAMAAVDGFAEEVRTAVISDISARFVHPDLAKWSAVLTVRSADHERLAGGALHDAEFGVFGKVSLARNEGEPIQLVRRTMLEWMDAADVTSMSSELQTSFGGGALTVQPPLIQVLPLALWL
jgi:hypothetical protein